jgi:hypothetical protein
MLRYLRGKGFLDLLHDLIAWLVPGRLGKVIAIGVSTAVAVGLMYVVNYPRVSRWF